TRNSEVGLKELTHGAQLPTKMFVNGHGGSARAKRYVGKSARAKFSSNLVSVADVNPLAFAPPPMPWPTKVSGRYTMSHPAAVTQNPIRTNAMTTSPPIFPFPFGVGLTASSHRSDLHAGLSVLPTQ